VSRRPSFSGTTGQQSPAVTVQGLQPVNGLLSAWTVSRDCCAMRPRVLRFRYVFVFVCLTATFLENAFMELTNLSDCLARL